MKRKFSPALITFLVLAILAVGFLQRKEIFPRWVKDYNPGKGKVYSGAMSPDQILAVLAGFREITAGILWVKADSFFDNGNYDAILPLIRLVTLLDPNEIDVYATGMWHIGYNFTDEEQRSDRRYIPSALALGRQGCEQNPDTYELYFEEGWMWYHKIDDDYDNAVKWFNIAQTKPDMMTARKNLLGMAYQRSGQIQDSINTYYRLFQDAEQKYTTESAFQNHQNRDTLENNLDNMLVRSVDRGWQAEQKHESLAPYAIYPPFDVGFSVKATVIEPRVIRFEGTWNVLPVGTRIRVVLRDADFPGATYAQMNWDRTDLPAADRNTIDLDPPRDETFMQDQLFVKNRRFNKKIDMSKDPTMYPFTKDKYLLEFYYDPRSAPPHIQDKFGWNGEGMTDKNFMDDGTKNDGKPHARAGQKVMYTYLALSRDQILRYGEWLDKTPVVKTSNYVDTSAGESTNSDVILKIPSLRTAGKSGG